MSCREVRGTRGWGRGGTRCKVFQSERHLTSRFLTGHVKTVLNQSSFISGGREGSKTSSVTIIYVGIQLKRRKSSV